MVLRHSNENRSKTEKGKRYRMQLEDTTAVKDNRGRLAQLVERRSVEREAAGSIRGQTNTQGLQITEDEGATSGLQTVRPSRGLDDHVEMTVSSPVGTGIDRSWLQQLDWLDCFLPS